MGNQRELYAKKLQNYYTEEKGSSEHAAQAQEHAAQAEGINLWEKHLEATQHFTRDFVAEVWTERRGIIGKIVLFIKRIFRKGTYYIFKQFTERVYGFQLRSVELSGQLIERIIELEGKERQIEERLEKQQRELSACLEGNERQANVSQEMMQLIEQRQANALQEILQLIEQRQANASQEILQLIEQRQDNASQEILQIIEQRQANASQEILQLIEQKYLNGIEGQLSDLRQKIDSLDRQSDAFSAAVAKMLMKRRRNENITVIQEDNDEWHKQEKANAGESAYTILDYFKFQNDFRGTRSVILERQKMYLSYFQNSAGPVIDVGCGRGEFLRLMKDNHITAFGVDLYPEYEVEGELNGLDIRQGNGIDFLKNSDQKFGGIFSAQVIEHISFSELQELCAAAYEKLLPGAYLVLETPNPTCLTIYTTTFYVDPTHNKPVHPLLLEYILKEVGFSDVQVVFTEASRLNAPLPLIESDAIRNLQEINNAITRVSNLLYGSLDYAVIAKK